MAPLVRNNSITQTKMIRHPLNKDKSKITTAQTFGQSALLSLFLAILTNRNGGHVKPNIWEKVLQLFPLPLPSIFFPMTQKSQKLKVFVSFSLEETHCISNVKLESRGQHEPHIRISYFQFGTQVHTLKLWL